MNPRKTDELKSVVFQPMDGNFKQSLQTFSYFAQGVAKLPFRIFVC